MIWNAINAKTGTAFMGDDTIADTVLIDVRSVRRIRDKLKKGGWLSWTQPHSANEYVLCFTRSAEMKKLREERKSFRMSDATPSAKPAERRSRIGP